LNGLDFLHRELRLIYAGESTLLLRDCGLD
jgi:hypothetical protein